MFLIAISNTDSEYENLFVIAFRLKYLKEAIKDWGGHSGVLI